MTRSPRNRRISALTACAGALAYTVSKVDLARDGELGMPGFPAPPDGYAQVTDVTAAQLGNAALGLLMAVVALLLLRPPGTRWLRWSVVGVERVERGPAPRPARTPRPGPGRAGGGGNGVRL
ncbi:hypothetical protein, partial [Streptomyces sp. NPDC089795]|uniref:hypothetical protein n=1 Tax=Streptomyces sp. NPDC089795 TaxID=3155297 RepID=UPI00344529FE